MDEKDWENLGVSLAGVKMRTPFGVAAVARPLVSSKHLTPERHAEMLLKHVEAGAGHICVNATWYMPEDLIKELQPRARPIEQSTASVTFRLMKMETPGIGMEGIYLISHPMLTPIKSRTRAFEQTLKMIELLRKKKPEGVPIIANIAGPGAFPEGFVATAKKVEEAGVDLIEVNVSCATSAAIEGMEDNFLERDFPLCLVGAPLGDRPDLVGNITKAVVNSVNVPVGVKISPETGYPRVIELARQVRDAGAKFITCLNQAVSIVPPDIYHGGRPRWVDMDGNPFVGASGAWLRPILYKQVAAIAKYAPGLEIVAAGGLVAPHHPVEVMMLGARVAQLCTGILYQGRNLVRRDVHFLNKYMKQEGYRTVEDFVGLALKYIKPINKVIIEDGSVFAEVDFEKCTGCGICADSICLASYMRNGRAEVNVEECSGCGMCVAVCASNARSLKRIPAPGMGNMVSSSKESQTQVLQLGSNTQSPICAS